MREADEVVCVTREWVLKAENDLKNAVHTLKMEPSECPTDTVCFHAQQCVEKYLKALLVLKGTGFPKSHDVAQLLSLLPKRLRPPISVEEQERLTNYATVARYPGGHEAIPIHEARGAVASARRVRVAIRRLLPRHVLRE